MCPATLHCVRASRRAAQAEGPSFPRLPQSRRVLTFTDVKGDFDVTATYAPGAYAPPPPSPSGDVIAVYRVSGVEKATAKHNATGKVTVTFSLDRGAMLRVDKASMQVEVIETYEVEVPANETAAAEEEEAEAEEAEEEAAADDKDNGKDKDGDAKADDKSAKADAKADAKEKDSKGDKKAEKKKEKKPKMVKARPTPSPSPP